MKKKKYKIELSRDQVCALMRIMDWTFYSIDYSIDVDPDLRRHFNAIHKLVKKSYKELDFQ